MVGLYTLEGSPATSQAQGIVWYHNPYSFHAFAFLTAESVFLSQLEGRCTCEDIHILQGQIARQ